MEERECLTIVFWKHWRVACTCALLESKSDCRGRVQAPPAACLPDLSSHRSSLPTGLRKQICFLVPKRTLICTLGPFPSCPLNLKYSCWLLLAVLISPQTAPWRFSLTTQPNAASHPLAPMPHHYPLSCPLILILSVHLFLFDVLSFIYLFACRQSLLLERKPHEGAPSWSAFTKYLQHLGQSMHLLGAQ